MSYGQPDSGRIQISLAAIGGITLIVVTALLTQCCKDTFPPGERSEMKSRIRELEERLIDRAVKPEVGK